MITYEEQLGDSRDTVSGTNIVRNLDGRRNSKDYQEGAHERRTMYSYKKENNSVVPYSERDVRKYGADSLDIV